TAFRVGTALAVLRFAGQAVFRRKFMATAMQKKKVHKVMHEHKKGTLKSARARRFAAGSRRSPLPCPNPANRRRQADDIGTPAERPHAAGIVYAGDLVLYLSDRRDGVIGVDALGV